MPIDPQKALADIEDVLNHDTGMSGSMAVDETVAVFKAAIERWAPAGSSYRKIADAVNADSPIQVGGSSRAFSQMRAPLAALKRDYEKGMVSTFEEMIHADVFAGLLDQASYLHGEGHDLPAAVVAGAALESHLRALAPKHEVAVDKTDAKGKVIAKMATALNQDLRRAGAYDLARERQVQVWIDYRNDAAHGKPEFKNHTPKDIEDMINGVRDFIVRFPA